MGNLFKNWKTTLGGVAALLLLVCRALGVDIPGHIDPSSLALGAAAAVGIFAKDSNK